GSDRTGANGGRHGIVCRSAQFHVLHSPLDASRRRCRVAFFRKRGLPRGTGLSTMICTSGCTPRNSCLSLQAHRKPKSLQRPMTIAVVQTGGDIVKRIFIVALAALLIVGWAMLPGKASSHREAPLISQDPMADNTDLYAFVSPDAPTTVTIIANYIP